MSRLLDFENHEKGFKPFQISRTNVKDNIGKRICYVDYVEPHRGTYFVRYGTIHSLKYSRLFLDDMHTEVNIGKIIEAGIKID